MSYIVLFLCLTWFILIDVVLLNDIPITYIVKLDIWLHSAFESRCDLPCQHLADLVCVYFIFLTCFSNCWSSSHFSVFHTFYIRWFFFTCNWIYLNIIKIYYDMIWRNLLQPKQAFTLKMMHNWYANPWRQNSGCTIQ
jgi:hypothetical protein